MKIFLISAVFIATISASSVWQIHVMDKLRKSAFIEGDFIIGALFPVHGICPSEISNTDPLHCDEIRESNGIQQVEAALFAVDAINNDQSLLPDIKIGITIKDECWNELVALYQTIRLLEEPSPVFIRKINPKLFSKEQMICSNQNHKPLISILGTASSTSTHQVQNLLKLFRIPQIGYSAPLLDLKLPYFYLSVVPNDYHEAYLIFKLLKRFGWNYISIAFTNGYLGINGKYFLQEWAPYFNICISSNTHVPHEHEKLMYNYAITQLLKDKRAKVIVCFCEDSTIKSLLKEIRNLNLTGEYLLLVSNDRPTSFAAIEGYEEQAQGSIMIGIKKMFVKEFDEYFLKKKLQNERNAWFKEFWEYQFQCKVDPQQDSDLPICTGKEDLSSNYKQCPKVSYVIKSIYAIARGLDQMRMGICNNTKGICPELYPFNTTTYMEYMINLNFSYHDEYVNFFFNRSPTIASYDIFNYQKFPNQSFGFIKISEYNFDINEQVDTNSEQFFNNFKYFDEFQFPGYSRIPIKSSCSDPCPKGYVQMRGNGKMDKLCCWTCIPCKSNEILLNETTCQPCPKELWPNENKTICRELPINQIQWTRFQFFMAKAFSILGIVLSLTTFIIFWKFKDTPVVKSSTAELCFIILLGSVMMHTTTFATFAEPTLISCGIVRAMPSLSTTFVYTPLLVKTNRIARLLAISKKKFPNLHPRMMTLKAQILMTVLLITTQMVICAFELVRNPPTLMKTLQKDSDLLTINITCDLTRSSEIYAFAFNIGLIILCTYYAVKTRNIPDNFNEAKFIGFLMYITCLSFTSSSLIFHGSDLKMLSTGVASSFEGFTVIVLLFFPKLYIILWAPDKNTREHFTTTTEIRCNIGRANYIFDSTKSNRCNLDD